MYSGSQDNLVAHSPTGPAHSMVLAVQALADKVPVPVLVGMVPAPVLADMVPALVLADMVPALVHMVLALAPVPVHLDMSLE